MILVNDLVRRIDAKIAELEKEEAMDAEKKQQEQKQIRESEIERFDLDETEDIKPKEEPIVNIDNDSIVVGEDTTDDQYYDDFFND